MHPLQVESQLWKGGQQSGGLWFQWLQGMPGQQLSPARVQEALTMKSQHVWELLLVGCGFPTPGPSVVLPLS